jgi:hypothetical protein
MHKKPIYGGRIDSDHGNRRSNAWCIPGKGDIYTKVPCGAAQNMDLFLHTRPLFTFEKNGSLLILNWHADKGSVDILSAFHIKYTFGGDGYVCGN